MERLAMSGLSCTPPRGVRRGFLLVQQAWRAGRLRNGVAPVRVAPTEHSTRGSHALALCCRLGNIHGSVRPTGVHSAPTSCYISAASPVECGAAPTDAFIRLGHDMLDPERPWAAFVRKGRFKRVADRLQALAERRQGEAGGVALRGVVAQYSDAGAVVHVHRPADAELAALPSELRSLWKKRRAAQTQGLAVDSSAGSEERVTGRIHWRDLCMRAKVGSTVEVFAIGGHGGTLGLLLL